MAIALIGTDSAGANNSSHVTTPGFDTTGANLIVIGVTSDVGGGSPTPTDSKSNAWTPLTQHTTSGGSRVRLFYCASPTVGTGHTFDLNQANTFPALIVIALSGAMVSSPFDVENGNAFNAATAISPGSVTPSVDGEIVISLLAVDNAATYAIDSSFSTPVQVNFVNGQHYGSALAYIIQTTAGAVAPTWSSWSTTDCSTAIATFKAQAGSFSYTPSGELAFAGAALTSTTATSTPRVIPAIVQHTPFRVTFPPLRPGYSKFFRGGTRLPSQIALSPFRNKRTLGNPTLIEASARLFTYFIAGVDRSAYVDVNRAPYGSSQLTYGATCAFVTQDASGGGWTPTEGDDILIFEGTRPVFRGSITQTVEERLIKTTVPRVTVTCGDVTVKMANRVVNAFYAIDSYGAVDLITQNLVFEHLADLGISYVAQVADFLAVGDQLFYCIPVTEALTQLAALMSANWTVDLNNNLRYLGISNAIVNGNGFSDASGNWLEVQATRTLALEGNRIFAKSSAQLLQSQTDIFPGDPVGIYTMTYPPRDQTLLPEVTVNAVEQVVVSIADAGRGVPYDFFRVGTVVQQNEAKTPLSPTDTVTITYPSPVPYVAVAEDAADIAANGLKEVILECGNITSKANLQAIAAAWLLRLKERATQLTVRAGGNVQGIAVPAANRDWQPGEAVSVNFTSSAGATPVVDTFLVDTVAWVIQDNAVCFQTLTLNNAQYQRTANPAQWMANIIAGLRTPALPVTQVMTLATSTNLGTGFVLNVDQQISLDSSNGPFTVTLPPPSELYGKDVTFKKISADSNPITIVGPVGRTIDGQANVLITTQNQSLVLAGNQWQ